MLSKDITRMKDGVFLKAQRNCSAYHYLNALKFFIVAVRYSWKQFFYGIEAGITQTSL